MDNYQQVNKYRKDILKSVFDLIKIPSVKSKAEKDAPYGLALKEALNYVLDLGEKKGFTVINYDNYAGEICFGEGDEIVGVICHLDVVPPQDKGWKKPPFEPYIENNIIYGRGSNDNKGPSMAAFYALVALKEMGFKPRKKLKMVFGCDEEGLMTCMDYYKSKTDGLPTKGFVPDGTFPLNYGEHGLYALKIDRKLPDYLITLRAGEHYHILAETALATIKHYPANIEELFSFFLRTNNYFGELKIEKETATIKLKGKAAHGSRPYVGHSAAAGILMFLAALYQDEELSELALCLSNWLGKELNINYRSEKYGELYSGFTMLETKDDTLSCFVDIRYPANLKGEEILLKINERLVKTKLVEKITAVDDRPGFYIEPDSENIRTLWDIYSRVSKDNINEPKVSAGDTYARKFSGLFAYGPTTRNHLADKRIGQAHQVNEGMDIETLITGCSIYFEALKTLLE